MHMLVDKEKLKENPDFKKHSADRKEATVGRAIKFFSSTMKANGLFVFKIKSRIAGAHITKLQVVL